MLEIKVCLSDADQPSDVDPTVAGRGAGESSSPMSPAEGRAATRWSEVEEELGGELGDAPWAKWSPEYGELGRAKSGGGGSPV